VLDGMPLIGTGGLGSRIWSGPDRPPDVEAAHAARVQRARRLAPRAHRIAGEHPRVRGGRRLRRRAGDALLLEGSWRALEERLDADEVLVVDPPETVRRQVVPLGPGARRTLAVTAAFVIAPAGGLTPPAVAGVLAATALVLPGTMDVEKAYRAISWTTVILIAGLIPVSQAIQSTGAAHDISDILVDAIGGSSPYLLFPGLFLIAAVFSVAVSNTATALILIPIGLSAAGEMDVATAPVLMSVAIACWASFLTPISTPGNMVVMGPGGYRFGDYWRFGLPFVALFFVVAVFLVPVIWSF
jgi:di/tricarboxylate transporter